MHFLLLFLCAPLVECYLTVSNHALENAECWTFKNSSLWWCKHPTKPKKIYLVNEEDYRIRSQGCQYSPPWHLNRITQFQYVDYSKPYRYTEYVVKPTIYIVDTWVQTDHKDFEGRVKFGYAAVPGSNNPHGTHVTGLAVSKTYGVCKHCNAVSVRVLKDDGTGYFSDLISGLSWISQHASTTQVSIINISISGRGSSALDLALEAIHRQGIVIVVAAGNDGRDASEYSPARSIHAISVGATNFNDQMSSFSNFGKSLDILAPGEYIQSTLPNDNEGWQSGTSMASPITAGAIALIVSKNSLVKDVWKLKQLLQDDSVKYVVKEVPSETVNSLVNTRDRSVCSYNKFIYQ